MIPALSLAGVSKLFGGFRALDAVSFDVACGEVHALLGENGAGKSTLMNIATGLYAPDEGHAQIDGVSVRLNTARDAAAHGIGMVHQHYKLVPSFTVLENLKLFNPGRSEQDLADAANCHATEIGFHIDLSKRVGLLGVAEQQRVEILKVLVAGARIVILDEPTAVLSDEEASGLMALMRGLRDAGKAIVLVTHKLNEALHHADRITVIRAGRKVIETRPADTDADRLTTDIVGALIVQRPAQAKKRGEAKLRVSHATRSGVDGRKGLVSASMVVHSGEIYGVAGVAGNGQSDLADVLAGIQMLEAGSIEVVGAGDVSREGPDGRARHGVAVIPVDRYRDGLAGDLSITDNFSIRGALAGKFGGWWRYHRREARVQTRQAVADFDIQGVRALGQRAALLSGGNAQKLVLAREFQGTPAIVIAHSPTRGLDVRASAAVLDRLRQARDRGAAVVLISEDLDELLLLADRIGVLSGGRIAAEFGTPADRQEIGKAMVGHV